MPGEPVIRRSRSSRPPSRPSGRWRSRRSCRRPRKRERFGRRKGQRALLPLFAANTAARLVAHHVPGYEPGLSRSSRHSNFGCSGFSVGAMPFWRSLRSHRRHRRGKVGRWRRREAVACDSRRSVRSPTFRKLQGLDHPDFRRGIPASGSLRRGGRRASAPRTSEGRGDRLRDLGITVYPRKSRMTRNRSVVGRAPCRALLAGRPRHRS
jgi:hypothetical protein